MFDHMTLHVSDFAAGKAFFAAALAPLGYRPVVEHEGVAAFGAQMPQFWLAGSTAPPTPIHLAFMAPDRAAVDAFYEAAIAAGGVDNGGPGLRPQYHADYYAAYVHDADGNNIEAVCHRPA
jgi:catechol 2,3-dioxygenase-like lactoylglutathione lyase family enzyme